MTIKEAEEKTGLSRSNIRFYEKEKLIDPLRNETNGYRNYSEKDIEEIKKIAYLRTLGISIEDIRNIISKKAALYDIVQKQNTALETQIADLNRAKLMCEKMLAAKNISYDTLQAEQYVPALKDYWNVNQPVFKLDSLSFLYLWGSFITWAAIASLCFITGLLSYTKLPPEIPIQWSGGAVTSLINKKFIFAYPAACAVFRCLLRPCLYARLQMYGRCGKIITEYLTNYMCFLALSIEIFTILYLNSIVNNVITVLFADTAVLIGLLIWGILKMSSYKK